MFANDFQGGPSFEVFTVQGSNPLAKWRIHGPPSSVRKDFDKVAKSAVFVVEGDTTRTKITLPKDEKQHLALQQRSLVLQIFIPVGHNFALDIAILDNGGHKRRILLSSSYKFIAVTAFHVKIPLSSLEKGVWLNLCLDVQSLTEDIFRGETFRWVDSLTICAACKLKRVFTLKTTPSNGNGGQPSSLEDSRLLLSSQSNAVGSQAKLQVITLETLLNSGVKFKVGAVSQEPSSGKPTDKSTHIAFGKRVNIPHHIKRQQSVSKDDSVKDVSATQVHGEELQENGEKQDHTKDIIDVQAHVPHPPSEPLSREGSASSSSGRRPIRRISGQKNVAATDITTHSAVSDGSYDASLENDVFSAIDNISPSIARELPVFKRNARYEKDPNNNKLQNSSSGYSSIKSNDYSHEFDEPMIPNLNDDDLIKGKEIIGKKNFESNVDSTALLSPGLQMGDDHVEEEYFKMRNNSRSEPTRENLRVEPVVAQLSGRSSASSKMSGSEGSDGLFLFSSQPRSVGRSSRSRRLSGSNGKSQRISRTLHVPPKKEKKQPRRSNNDDFHGESSDSDTELRKVNVDRPKSGIRMKQHEKLRQSIQTSMLREIEAPKQSGYNHNKYQSVDSDSMSWMYDSDSSTDTTHSTFEDESPEQKSKAPKLSNEANDTQDCVTAVPHHTTNGNSSASEDELSTASDDTSWKAPPLNIHNYRYQKEMNGLQMTLDLSETLPMTPFTAEEPSNFRDSLESDSGVPKQEPTVDLKIARRSSKEELLDLLYDPVFKCYFDPVSRKYYELI